MIEGGDNIQPDEPERFGFIEEIGVAIGITQLLITIYDHLFNKNDYHSVYKNEKFTSTCANYAGHNDFDTFDHSEFIRTITEISRHHLCEAGIPLDCKLLFFNKDNEVIFSEDGQVPRERINAGNVMGMYKPATGTAYIRLASPASMISTISHEVAHHYLTTRSALGNFMKGLDAIYEVHKEGPDLAVDTIIKDVKRDHAALFRMSNRTQEGFASWVGHYVLKQFVETTKAHIMSNPDKEISKDVLQVLLSGYEDLSSDLDRRAPEYYYGRLDICSIEKMFGLKCVPVAARICMDVKYDVEDLPRIWAVHSALCGEETVGLAENFPCLKVSPDLRLAALSRLLPSLVHAGDDISKINDVSYLLRAVGRYFGEDFLDPEIKVPGLEYAGKLSGEQPVSGLSNASAGYLLAEIAYGSDDVRQAVNRLGSAELARYLDICRPETVRKKAAEMLMCNSADDILVGEAIYKLGMVTVRSDIMEVLGILKKHDEGAVRLYEMVRNNEFRTVWPRYLKELQMEMVGKL